MRITVNKKRAMGGKPFSDMALADNKRLFGRQDESIAKTTVPTEKSGGRV